MLVLGIDIGVSHLAYCLCDYNDLHVEACKLTNLNKIILRCKNKKCQIPHTRETVDKMLHFFELNKQVFAQADVVAIERQPITGILNVQDLIFMKYREKAVLVSPNAMHNLFSMKGDYDARKEKAQCMFVQASKTSEANEEYSKWCRRHDIADAYCIARYFIETDKSLRRAEAEAAAPNRFEEFCYLSMK